MSEKLANLKYQKEDSTHMSGGIFDRSEMRSRATEVHF